MLKTVSSITNAIGALNFKGTWDANANSPALASSVGTKGDYYVVGTAGSTNLNGISNWGIGDWATYNGSVWQRVEGGADLNGVNVSFTGTASGPTYETSNAAAGLTITNNDITADGTDTNIDIDITPKGTGEVNLPKVDIDGGAIDATTIGASTASSGAFTTLSANNDVSFDGGTFVFNESGADKDARFEGDTNTALLFTDASTDRVGFNTSTPQAKTETYDSNGQTIEKLRGNGLSAFQGEAEYMRVVRHCPVVSLGTKLIIPFVSQGSLWESTTVRVMGVGARYSNSTPLGFEATFTVSHISALNALSAWNSGGNYASIAVNGLNVEITFTTAYTSATQDGVFVMLEFITGRQNFAIDVANIAMN